MQDEARRAGRRLVLAAALLPALAQGERDPSGALRNMFQGVIVKDLADAYVGDCAMR